MRIFGRRGHSQGRDPKGGACLCVSDSARGLGGREASAGRKAVVDETRKETQPGKQVIQDHCRPL